MGKKLESLEEKPGAIESTYLGKLAVHRGGVLKPGNECLIIFVGLSLKYVIRLSSRRGQTNSFLGTWPLAILEVHEHCLNFFKDHLV